MTGGTAHELYQARIPIYPRSVHGRFRTLKWGILALAYGVYFLLPWVRWERTVGVPQAVSFDIEARRFYLFDLVVHAQDIFWLAGLLVIAALLLFFVTGIAGRVFCGYFCFQTLWTDVFLLIERLVQGERPARIRLDKQPWNAEKLAKKTLTHFLWLGVGFWTGFTFTLYWGNAPELFRAFFTGTAPFPAYATTLFITLTTYVMAGLAREQVCTYMCPYSRFQGAMFDRSTLIVAYDEKRGEGGNGRHKIVRGFKSREERQVEGAGDCIDCGYCVQVCPTGIDIRNGLQNECIACAACIDVCDDVMGKMGYAPGLIRYSSGNAIAQSWSPRQMLARVWRPRVLIYGSLLLAASLAFVISLSMRSGFGVDIIRDRGALARETGKGRIENVYRLQIRNSTEQAQRFSVQVSGLPGLQLATPAQLEVPAIGIASMPVRLTLAQEQAEALRGHANPIRFMITRDGDLRSSSEPSTFFVPR